MDEEHLCLHEEDWGSIKALLQGILNKVSTHVEDSERSGGYRDRILILEKKCETCAVELIQIKKDIKEGFIKSAIVGGIIGGLIGQLTPEVFSFIISLLKR